MRHHGDVIILPVSELPDPSLLKLMDRDENGRAIIAEGELSGHAHAICADDVEIYQLIDTQDMTQRFMRVMREVTIEHEEHGPMTLSPGLYEARIAREIDPIQGVERRVLD
jgi:hypothetical protein